MHAWIWLIVAVVAAVALLYITHQHQATLEGFVTVDLNTATAQRQMLQFEGERRYNNFARVQSPRSFIPADQVQAALQQEIPVPTSTSHSLMSLLGFVGLGAADDGSNKQGPTVEQTGVVQQKINFCESMTTVNCDLLDDPRLAECGFCHRDGKDSNGKPFRGGLFISSDDQIRANEVAMASGKPAVYKPTIGACKPQNFSLMKENCQVIQVQMQCQIAGGPTSTNPCGQCFGPPASSAGATGMLYMGPKPRAYTAILHVSHPGSHSSNGAGLIVRYANGYQVTLPPSNQALLDPQQLTLTISEGDNLVISVVGVPTVWCAWLSSSDGKRSVSIDIGDQGIVPASGFTVIGDARSSVVSAAMSAAADPTAWANFQNQIPNSVMWYKRNDSVVPGAITSAWYGNTTQGSPNAQGIDVTSYIKMAATSDWDVTVSNQYFGNQDPAPNIPKHIWVALDNGNTIILPEGSLLLSSQIANSMVMNFTVPATLVDPLFENDMANCPTGPIIMTEVGAGLMGSHSCFKPDGSFNPSMYCMQELWTAAGGTPQGNDYPKTDKDAAIWAVADASGNPNLDATVAALNNGVNIAMYGVDMNGAPQEFEVIKSAALSFLGITMNSPCDGPSAQTGPHSPECLDYLWRTSGNPSTNTGDPTKLPYAYCKKDGGAAPLNKDGTVNQSNVTMANTYGAIPNVRTYYQNIFNRTQDNSDFDAQAIAMRDCYNVHLKVPKEDPATCPTPNPDEWQCIGPKQVTQPEVFFVLGPGVKTTADAGPVCAAYGAQVATTAQVATAQQQGAKWCGSGWVSDSTTIAPPNTGCSTGVAGVNCFGNKPATGTPDVLPFNGSVWRNPASMPAGWSGDNVIVAKEAGVGNIVCASPANATSCLPFPSEQQCSDFLATNKTTMPGQLAVASAMSGAIDQYIRGRV